MNLPRRIIQTTADGSHTIVIPGQQVSYHSKHGALQESLHVFIQAGLLPLLHRHQVLQVFEMGFGTGLNALLSLQTAIVQQQAVHYCTVEPFPLSAAEAALLNYGQLLGAKEYTAYLQQLHAAAWERDERIHPYFTLHKMQQSLLQLQTGQRFHLVYYDAFDPVAQPELWTEAVFAQLAQWLQPGGVLVTYCSKGAVRRAMQHAGLRVEKLPGPPGKREILRAYK